jgi:hypothetical protein
MLQPRRANFHFDRLGRYEPAANPRPQFFRQLGEHASETV